MCAKLLCRDAATYAQILITPSCSHEFYILWIKICIWSRWSKYFHDQSIQHVSFKPQQRDFDTDTISARVSGPYFAFVQNINLTFSIVACAKHFQQSVQVFRLYNRTSWMTETQMKKLHSRFQSLLYSDYILILSILSLWVAKTEASGLTSSIVF